MSINIGVPARRGLLRHLPALFRLAWAASPRLTAASVALRLVRAALPALMLYVAKLVVNAVVAGRAEALPDAAMTGWLSDPHLRRVTLLVGLELALAVASDLLRRATTLVDGVLAEMTSNATTLRLMAHAATLDLDRFERGRSRRPGAHPPPGDVALEAHRPTPQAGADLVTAVSLAAAVMTFLPWLVLVLLLVMALLPAFVNELISTGAAIASRSGASPTDARSTTCATSGLAPRAPRR